MLKKLVLLVWGLVVMALLLEVEVSTVSRLLPPSLSLPLLAMLNPGSRVFRLEECGCYRSLAPASPGPGLELTTISLKFSKYSVRISGD